MKYDDLKYLSVPLPEPVLKEKWSGSFDKAVQTINSMLGQDIPKPLRRRLELELNSIKYIKKKYSVSEEEALAIIRREIPDMTAGEMELLRKEDKIDWMYVEGKVKYINSFAATLYKVYPEIWRRREAGDTADFSHVQAFVENAEDGRAMKAHIHIKHELRIRDSAVEEGRKLMVQLPVPVERYGIKNLKVLETKPDCGTETKPDCVILPNSDAAQPTVCFVQKARKNQVFSIEYQLDNEIIYKDISKIDVKKAAETAIPEEEKVYLKEKLPHIRFTPFLRSLLYDVAGDETNPLIKARKIYDFITTKANYRFMRDYCSVDNLSEYCAVNRRGDCGVFALLFITLCRLAGIPAKWQSGLDAKPGAVGEHDWAMFYIPSAGWLYADLSYGAAAYIRGAFDRWNFYFGNVDPYRIAINDDFQEEFETPKNHWRIDPYDNQCGEAEYEERGLSSSEIEYKYTEIDIHAYL